MNDRTVQLALTHRVRFTRNAFDIHNISLVNLFKPASVDAKALVVVDQSLIEAQPGFQENIESYFDHHLRAMPTLIGCLALNGGEAIKTDLSNLEYLLRQIHIKRIDRHSYILAIGGGALLDMVSFAAAVAHRGVRLIRMPTTTLSQCDSGVGVKNAVNMFGTKNFIGTFATPYAVINDHAMLDTLSDRDWRCGLAEAIKVALIKSAELFDYIEKNLKKVLDREPAVSDRIWQWSAKLHLDHIVDGGDPYEHTNARPLDFGHWSAHQLESLTDYQLRHGEAVAVGVAIDTLYSAKLRRLPQAAADRVCNLLSQAGFELFHPALTDADFKQGIEQFREHLGGPLRLTMIQDIGQAFEVDCIDDELLNTVIRQLEATTRNPVVQHV
jgi:3-dehydroquinate synthase